MEAKAGIASTVTIAFLFYLPVILGFTDFLRDPLEVSFNIELVSNSLRFTLFQAALSATLSLATGAPAGVALALEGHSRSRPYRLLYTVAFMAPPMAVVMGFTALYGREGILSSLAPGLQAIGEGFWAIIAAHVFYNAPLAALMVYSSFSSMQPGYWDLVRAYGGIYNRYVATRIIIPNISRAAIYSWLIAFIYCFTSFAIPLTLGGPQYSTLEVLIYYNYRMLRWDVASAIAFIQFIILFSIVASLSRLSKPAAAPAGAPPTWPGAPRTLKIYLALFTIYLVLPMLGLIYKSLETPKGIGIDNYASLLSTGIAGETGISATRVMVNSIYFAIATLATVIFLATIAAIARGRVPDIAATLLLAISPVTIGFGLARTLLPIAPPWVAVILGHAFAAYPLAANTLRVGIARVQKGFIEVAEAAGETPLGTLIRVVAPLALPAYVTAGSLSVAVSLGEFGATMILRTKETVTLGVLPYIYRSYRLFGEAYASAAILLLATGIAVYMVERMGGRAWARK